MENDDILTKLKATLQNLSAAHYEADLERLGREAREFFAAHSPISKPMLAVNNRPSVFQENLTYPIEKMLDMQAARKLAHRRASVNYYKKLKIAGITLNY